MVTSWDRFIDAIERKKQQLDEVLDAYRVFREKLDALPPDLAIEAQKALGQDAPPAKDGTPPQRDLAGKTSLECIRIILTEGGNEAQHFSAIAKEAMKRGYVGRLSGSPEEVESRTSQSFWSAMSRAGDLESMGKGLYKLRTWPPSQESDAEHETAPKEKSRMEQVRDFLQQNGPMQRKSILEKTGIPEGTIGMILKEGPDSPFAKDATGRWYVRKQEDAVPAEEKRD